MSWRHVVAVAHGTGRDLVLYTCSCLQEQGPWHFGFQRDGVDTIDKSSAMLTENDVNRFVRRTARERICS